MKTLFRFTLAALLLLTINSFSQTGGAGDALIDMTNLAGGDNYSPGGGAEPGTAEITGEYFLRNSVFCDDFDRANSTNVVGWTEQSGDWQIYNNMLQIPVSTTADLQYWRYITVDGSAQVNGCMTGRAIYGSVSRVKFVGLVARYVSWSSRILFKIQDNSGVGYFNRYFLYVDGNMLKATSGNFGTDAIIQMEYTDADVTLRIDTDRDGTWDVTDIATVSNLNSGLCGVGSWGEDCFMDDYCCGATCETGNSVPISNMALFIALFLMVSFIIIRIYRR